MSSSNVSSSASIKNFLHAISKTIVETIVPNKILKIHVSFVSKNTFSSYCKYSFVNFGNTCVKLNIYDRNTKVDIVREGDEKGQYAVCDTITQSQLTLKNGKKIHPNDINICSSLTGIGTREAYSYDAAIKVFEEVKAKLDYEMDDPRDYITEEKENKKENTNNVKR